MGNRLEGKNAVIFGGAGRIGSALAKAYLNEGANIILIDRNEEKLNDVKKDLSNYIDSKCKILKANIENTNNVQNMISKLKEMTDTVDILVNCPAYIHRAPFLECPLEEIDKQWHINVRIVFMISQAIANLMAKKGNGKIINIASIGGLFPEKEHSGHCAAKAGIIAISKVMALELASYNIQVNVVAPGPTETIPFSSPFYNQHPEILSMINAKTPAGRIGHPEDHTGLMVFLASEEANWITGQIILSDGGLSLI